MIPVVEPPPPVPSQPAPPRQPVKRSTPAKPQTISAPVAPARVTPTPSAAPSSPPPFPPVAPSAPPPDYLAAIQARLARYKVYPRAAQTAREEGTVLLRFVIGQDGTILRWTIVQGSGHESLDQAAESMIERASPLPPIPVDLGRDRLEVTLPVRFALR